MVAFIMASLHLVAWTLNFEHLLPQSHDTAFMAPSSAVSICILSAFLIQKKNGLDWNRVLSLGMIGFVLAICTFNLVGALSGFDRVDQILFGSGMPATMSPSTSIGLSVVAVSLILILTELKIAELIIAALATICLCASSLIALAHLFDTDTIYGLGAFSEMSLWTSSALVLLSFCLLRLQPYTSWITWMEGDLPGARHARRLMPFAIILPLAVSAMVVGLYRNNQIDMAFGATILVFILILVFGAAILASANIENQKHIEQEQLVADLRASIKDRELLLREVNHRVKNNLQQISALLHIHAMRANSDSARDPLDAMIHRIDAMGVVQKLLLQNETADTLNARQFLPELCENMSAAMGGDVNGVQLACEADDIDLAFDAAMSIGLIVNELVVNAFKYAFVEDADAEIDGPIEHMIKVSLKRNSTHVYLEVRDNGVGQSRKTDEDSNNQQGAGSMIVEGLSEDLNAKMITKSDNGLIVTLRIPKIQLEARS